MDTLYLQLLVISGVNTRVKLPLSKNRLELFIVYLNNLWGLRNLIYRAA